MGTLANLSIFVTFGVALDLILFGAEEKAALQRYLKSERKSTWNGRFIAFIEQANVTIFSRFFAGNLVSRRFLLASFVVSSGSFFVAIALQSYFGDNYTDILTFSGEQLVILLVLFTFNLLFDYASIVQTKIFVGFAIQSGSALKSILLLFADAVVKMNAFILAFSLVLLGIIYVYTASPKQLTLIFPSKSLDEEHSGSISEEMAQEYGLRPEIAESMGLESIPVIVAAENESNLVVVLIYATSGLDYSRQMKEYFQRFGSISVEVVSIESEEGEVKDLIDKYRRNKFPDPVIMNVVAYLRFKSIRDLDWGYTGVFLNVDQIENGFPGTLFGTNAFLKLDKAISDSTRSISQRGPWYYCEAGDVARSGYVVDSAVPKDCSALAIHTDVGSSFFAFMPDLPSNLIVSGRDLKDLWIPYTTLFITSLLPTTMFLIGSILLIITTLVFQISHYVSLKMSRYIERAPFAIASFLLGGVMLILGIV